MPTEKWVTYLRDNFRTMWYVPIAFITGKTGKNVKAMLNHAQMLFRQSLERVRTPHLNKLVGAAMEQNPPPLYQNRRPKIYYATQVAAQPPTIVLFCNDPKAISPQYQRYLLRVFRDELKFGEVPIKLYLRPRARRRARRDRSQAGPTAAGLLEWRLCPREFRKKTVWRNSMIVGVPKEIKRDEYRVGLLPVGVEELTRAGHRVLVEAGAGLAPG